MKIRFIVPAILLSLTIFADCTDKAKGNNAISSAEGEEKKKMFFVPNTLKSPPM